MEKGRFAWISIIATAVLSVVAHVGIREWYRADLRYEVGSYYISGESAITSLRLRNMGHSDAVDITVAARFLEPISQVDVDNPAVTFEVTNGGTGKRFVIGRIARIVPEQQVYVFFALSNPGSFAFGSSPSFVREITYAGGKAETGEPKLWSTTFEILMILLIGGSLATASHYLFAHLEKRADQRLRELEAAIAPRKSDLLP